MIFIVQYTINNVLYIKWTQEYNTVHIIGRDSAKKIQYTIPIALNI